MHNPVYILVAAALLLTFSCTEKEAHTSQDRPDSTLQIEIQKRLAQKKEIQRLRHQLNNSNMGRALARYKPIIKKYAKHYGFDWRLIAAQIVKESGFHTKARSHVGARGLMQLMPRTAQEISKELDIYYIMKNPRENITAGIYHLRKQYHYFPDATKKERIKFALASYNGGAGRVFDAQNIARHYRRPVNRWDSVSPYLSMLKESDWQLHLQIWPDGKPRYGYFYGYNETINYVNGIWTLYEAYRLIL
jgi:membrane-bound lytic murein transglycosylase F